jgi:hypothetical protein
MDPHGGKPKAGYVSLYQLKVMSAIEDYRTVALGGDASAHLLPLERRGACGGAGRFRLDPIRQAKR